MLFCTALALACGWSIGRRRGIVFAGLDLGFILPVAVPASLIAIALIRMTQPPSALESLYATGGSLLWAYVVLFYPYAHKLLQPAWDQLDQALLDDSALLGAGGWTRFRVIAWPGLKAPVVLAIIVVGVLASREMDATFLLRVPDGDTIAFRVHDYLHFAPGPKVAALCLVLAALSAAAVALARWVLRGRGDGE